MHGTTSSTFSESAGTAGTLTSTSSTSHTTVLLPKSTSHSASLLEEGGGSLKVKTESTGGPQPLTTKCLHWFRANWKPIIAVGFIVIGTVTILFGLAAGGVALPAVFILITKLGGMLAGPAVGFCGVAVGGVEVGVGLALLNAKSKHAGNDSETRIVYEPTSGHVGFSGPSHMTSAMSGATTTTSAAKPKHGDTDHGSDW